LTCRVEVVSRDWLVALGCNRSGALRVSGERVVGIENAIMLPGRPGDASEQVGKPDGGLVEAAPIGTRSIARELTMPCE
jgi:hypothetical protein